MLAKLPEYEQRVSVRQFHQVPGSVRVHLFLTFRTSAIVLPIPVPAVSPSIIQTCERCLQAAYDVVSGRQVALDPSNFIKYCDAYKISFVSYVSPKLPAAGLLAEAPAAHQYRPPMPGSHKVPPAVLAAPHGPPPKTADQYPPSPPYQPPRPKLADQATPSTLVRPMSRPQRHPSFAGSDLHRSNSCSHGWYLQYLRDVPQPRLQETCLTCLVPPPCPSSERSGTVMAHEALPYCTDLPPSPPPPGPPPDKEMRPADALSPAPSESEGFKWGLNWPSHSHFLRQLPSGFCWSFNGGRMESQIRMATVGNRASTYGPQSMPCSSPWPASCKCCL